MRSDPSSTHPTSRPGRPGSLRLAVLAAGAATCCLLSTGAARAADRLFDAAACQPRGTTDIGDLNYASLGVRNLSSGTTFVECPFWLPFNGALTVNSVSVAFYDRNPASNVTCTVKALSIQGTVISSLAVSSAGSGAGVQFGNAVFNQPVLGTMRMSCSIPAATPMGASSVATYRLITTP